MNKKIAVIFIAVLCLLTLSSCVAPFPSSTIVAGQSPAFSPSATAALSPTPDRALSPSASPSPSPTLTLPVLPPLPADSTETVDRSLVMVWGNDGQYATGVAIGDGSQVLTTWDWEAVNIGDLKVIVPGDKAYNATVQAFDSRTAATVLSVEGMKLPVPQIRDTLTLRDGENVTARGWNLPAEYVKVPVLTSINNDTFPVNFGIHYPPENLAANRIVGIRQGAVVTDGQGNVLGIVGVDYMTLMPHPHPFPFIPAVAGIRPGMDLRSTDAQVAKHQLWANRPLQIRIADKFGTSARAYFPEYEEVAWAIGGAENRLGAPLSETELKEYQRSGTTSSDGTTLTAVYARPVDLCSLDLHSLDLRAVEAKLLASAKWVGIQWGRSGSKPNRLFYGNAVSTVEGGFEIEGDISSLTQIITSVSR